MKLITGTAKAADGTREAFSLVCKKQKKWSRPGDPLSWRREYDLYASDLGEAFTDSLRWPECCHAEINDDEMQLWTEYIDGVSGAALTIDMLEEAARELGRFQGRVSRRRGELKQITCLGDEGFMEIEFEQWHTQTFSYNYLISEPCRMPEFLKQMLKNGGIELTEGKSFEYGLLRSKGCDIPPHLKRMLADIDDSRAALFGEFRRLPTVLCHRDFWNENILCSGGKIRLIDWDTAGWGFLGEDIASLIVDGMEVSQFEENCRCLIPAYLRGVSEYMDIPRIDKELVLTMTLIKFGYRKLQQYIFTQDPKEKIRGLSSLQKIYEMRNCRIEQI